MDTLKENKMKAALESVRPLIENPSGKIMGDFAAALSLIDSALNDQSNQSNKNDDFGISFETLTYSHIHIIGKTEKALDFGDPLVEELNHKVIEILSNYNTNDVREDTEFRCHLPTEIGLVGSNKESVKQASIEIADYVKTHEYLELFSVEE